MPVGPRHHLPDLPKIPSGDVFVEKIGHGVDENYRRILPLERIAKAMRAQSDTETVWECPIGTVYRNALGIAKLAAGRYLIAARDRIPGVFSPRDFCTT